MKYFMKYLLSLDSESQYEVLGKIVLLMSFIILLIRGCLGGLWYGEIDSNALPVISIQYRGSTLMEQSDLLHAQEDFPELYNGINSYQDLRSSKLILLSNEKWMSYYFPIYPLLCIPVKLLLSFLSVSQEQCFTITNALLVSLALYFVQRKLQISAEKRFFAVVLLLVSPVIFYINYINYEAFVFSMLTISLVEYINQNKYLSAVFLSLGGMSNPTVMAVGLVMISKYLICGIRELRNHFEKNSLLKFMCETIKYALCFVPCLIPFWVQYSVAGSTTYTVSARSGNYLGARMLMYFFDTNLGFFSFAPLLVVLFFILVVVGGIKRDIQALIWTLFLIGTVGAVSLMPHINCASIYCARYVVWIYPIIPIFISCIGFDYINMDFLRFTSFVIAVCTTMILVSFNIPTMGQSYDFNNVTRFLLEYCPGLYNPYSATFYCRTLHIDGAYDITDPAYYYSEKRNEIRKLIFKDDEGVAENILDNLIGDEQSMEYLKEELFKHGTDGKFHYINFPLSGQYQVREKEQDNSSG